MSIAFCKPTKAYKGIQGIYKGIYKGIIVNVVTAAADCWWRRIDGRLTSAQLAQCCLMLFGAV